ncbi:MAG: THUMP domain-containing protein [Candidatus Thermoplasmatota archaeon]|nr:THUMP domain-containing protein [Candidatus Thermoplasmatota archaeon]
MNERFILVRYGELALKKRETRRHFENTLKRNITSAFASQHIDCRIETSWGRLFVHTSDLSKGMNILQHIFGITSISPVVLSSSDLRALSKDLTSYLTGKIYSNDSFALRVTRVGTHTYTSQEVAVQLGDDIRHTFSNRVDLNKPDNEIFIEIRDDKAYIYLEKIPGPGGMPLGTQGRVCAVLRCEDDVVASWFLLRRGCSMVFFLLDPTVEDSLSLLTDTWFVPSKIYYKTKTQDSLKHLDLFLVSHHCIALCTGDSFSKKKKDLMGELHDMKKGISRPILTPLITMTVDEIEQKKVSLGLKP